MVRGCGCRRAYACPPPGLAGGYRLASQRVFQGQLELPAGSGCDITGRRKTLGPGFCNEAPSSARAQRLSLRRDPQSANSPHGEPGLDFFLLNFFFFFFLLFPQ